MRGFAFIGGEGPDCSVELGIETADVIVAADSGLDAVHARGLRADWIVGDMDSLADRSLLSFYPAERIRAFPPEKDDTDTELALRLLEELGCSERILVGGGGGRLDHTLAIRALFDRPTAPERWVTKLESVWFLDANHGTGICTIEVAPGALVSLFPVGEGPWRVKSRGLRWPLDNLTWDRGRFGISNVSEGATCGVAVEAGGFLLVTPLGASVSCPGGISRKLP